MFSVATKANPRDWKFFGGSRFGVTSKPKVQAKPSHQLGRRLRLHLRHFWGLDHFGNTHSSDMFRRFLHPLTKRVVGSPSFVGDGLFVGPQKRSFGVAFAHFMSSVWTEGHFWGFGTIGVNEEFGYFGQSTQEVSFWGLGVLLRQRSLPIILEGPLLRAGPFRTKGHRASVSHRGRFASNRGTGSLRPGAASDPWRRWRATSGSRNGRWSRCERSPGHPVCLCFFCLPFIFLGETKRKPPCWGSPYLDTHPNMMKQPAPDTLWCILPKDVRTLTFCQLMGVGL